VGVGALVWDSMEDSTWQREIIINGAPVVITFIKRPFREGIEAKVTLGDKTVTLAELGLGEQALIERIRGEIGLTITHK